MLSNTICGSINLDNFNKDNFKVKTTLGSMRKPYDICLLIKSLFANNKANSPRVDKLTTRDVK